VSGASIWAFKELELIAEKCDSAWLNEKFKAKCQIKLSAKTCDFSEQFLKDRLPITFSTHYWISLLS
jgi:hypothetical protein